MQFTKSLFLLAAVLAQVSALPASKYDVDFEYKVMTVKADQGNDYCVYFTRDKGFPKTALYHFTSCSSFKAQAQRPINQFRIDNNGFVRPNSGSNAIDGFIGQFVSAYNSDALHAIKVPSETPKSAFKYSATNQTLYSSATNNCIMTEFEYSSLMVTTSGCVKVGFRPLSDFQ